MTCGEGRACVHSCSVVLTPHVYNGDTPWLYESLHHDDKHHMYDNAHLCTYSTLLTCLTLGACAHVMLAFVVPQ